MNNINNPVVILVLSLAVLIAMVFEFTVIDFVRVSKSHKALSLLPQASAASSAQCQRKELREKDCHLKAFGRRLHIWQDKIFVSDGVRRKAFDLPVAGLTIEWSKVQLKKIRHRRFLELLIWGPPQGEAQVQSLKWSIYEVTGERLKLLVDQEVQKRLPDLTREAHSGGTQKTKEVVKSKKDKETPKTYSIFNYEKKAKFGLLVKPKQALRWYVNNKKEDL